jgi:hypothetical protein
MRFLGEKHKKKMGDFARRFGGDDPLAILGGALSGLG